VVRAGDVQVTSNCLESPVAGQFANVVLDLVPDLPVVLLRVDSPYPNIDAWQEPRFQSMPEFFGELNFL
jgi:hypothetical protein